MKVVIIDYGAGNIFSVQQAFKRLGVETVLSKDEQEIRAASHVIFPGVGHAKSAMDELQKTGLDKVIPKLTQPVLGICLGMQLMCGYNEEGDLEGLGIFKTRIFELKSGILKTSNFENSEFENPIFLDFYICRRPQENCGIQKFFSSFPFPHMGWNDVQFENKSEAFYFVHSYAAEVCEYTSGITEYPIPFSAALRKDNFWGVQFHPEKSGVVGAKLLEEFLAEK